MKLCKYDRPSRNGTRYGTRRPVLMRQNLTGFDPESKPGMFFGIREREESRDGCSETSL